ncbi:Chaperone protein ClpD1, chloroplastic [Hondaea fermentalgiana]|uniref:Chaperone protein ClpD1, chloroplastic n=1 Tax=Hondaea fermentalgiana TaxID=2315210 RepID=A0A2R5GE52_9STRA|nr:Chaperone protein ClpD1, chloroplastic [Hondaea fermentalgiana]|eukprot:GBG28855.1 Chaperone protein ClpD1, chloroplastic [Hondaea fermentalgiana]
MRTTSRRRASRPGARVLALAALALLLLLLPALAVAASAEFAEGSLGDDLANVDSLRGGGLKKWAEADGSGASKVLALAGDVEAHQEALLAVLREWKPRLAKKDAMLKIRRRREATSGEILNTVSRWLKSRIVADELKWSLVYVENAALDKETTRDVNEMVSSLGNRESCIDADNDLNIPRCGKLLIVLSTNFGEEVARMSRDTLAIEADKGILQDSLGRKARTTLDEVCRRESNVAWMRAPELRNGLGRLMLSGARQLVYPVFGLPQFSNAGTLIDEMKKLRAKRVSPSDDGSLPVPPPLPTSPDAVSDACIDEDVIRRAGFVGQVHAVDAVKSMLKQIRHGWRSGDGPVVLLFAGPAGLGKTLLAKLVARAYNCGMPKGTLERENFYKEIDMVNYQDERSVDGFVDPAPGLAGSGIMADLFSSSQRNVILLDEIEKCHPSLVEKMLLPMIDNNGGHVQAKKSGDVFPTRESIFIMTTNCFDEEIAQLYRRVQPTSEGFDKEAFMRLSEAVARLMKDPTQKCRGSHSEQANPFSSGPFWRRLVAGSSLVTRHGVVPFVPPSSAEMDELVRITLESYCTRSGQREIFYSHRALLYLQNTAREKMRANKLSSGTVEAFIIGEVTEAIPESILYSDVRTIVLYQNPVSGRLAAIGSDDAGTTTSNSADMKINNMKECESSWPACEDNSEQDSTGQDSSKSSAHKGSSSSFTPEEEVEYEPEQAQDHQPELKQRQESASDVDSKVEFEMARMFVHSVLLIVTVYFFSTYMILPAAKMLMTTVAVVAAILYFVAPQLFWILWEAIKTTWELLRWAIANPYISIPLAGGFYLLLLFLRKRKRTEQEKAISQLKGSNVTLQAERDALRVQVKTLEMDRDALSAQVDGLRAENADLRQHQEQHQEQQQDTEELSRKIESLQKDLDERSQQPTAEELTRKIESLQKDLEKLRTENTELQKDREWEKADMPLQGSKE